MKSFQGIGGRADGSIETRKTVGSVWADFVLMIEGAEGGGKRHCQQNDLFDEGSHARGFGNIFLTKGRVFARIDMSHRDIELRGEPLSFPHSALAPRVWFPIL